MVTVIKQPFLNENPKQYSLACEAGQIVVNKTVQFVLEHFFDKKKFEMASSFLARKRDKYFKRVRKFFLCPFVHLNGGLAYQRPSEEGHHTT